MPRGISPVRPANRAHRTISHSAPPHAAGAAAPDKIADYASLMDALTDGATVRDQAPAQGDARADAPASDADLRRLVTIVPQDLFLFADTIRAVEYSGYTVNYCPSCQTGGKILADKGFAPSRP